MSTDDKSKDISLSDELREKLKKERHPRKVEPGFAMEAYTLWVTLKEGYCHDDLSRAVDAFQGDVRRAYPDPKPELCGLTGEVKELSDYDKTSLRRYIVDCSEERAKVKIAESLRGLEMIEAVDLQPIIGLPRNMFEEPKRIDE